MTGRMIEILILVVHVIAAVGVIGLVLLQHGKGADMGAAFGSGASGSLFGASGLGQLPEPHARRCWRRCSS